MDKEKLNVQCSGRYYSLDSILMKFPDADTNFHDVILTIYSLTKHGINPTIKFTKELICSNDDYIQPEMKAVVTSVNVDSESRDFICYRLSLEYQQFKEYNKQFEHTTTIKNIYQAYNYIIYVDISKSNHTINKKYFKLEKDILASDLYEKYLQHKFNVDETVDFCRWCENKLRDQVNCAVKRNNALHIKNNFKGSIVQ